jgi:hypothetical protein
MHSINTQDLLMIFRKILHNSLLLLTLSSNLPATPLTQEDADVNLLNSAVKNDVEGIKKALADGATVNARFCDHNESGEFVNSPILQATLNCHVQAVALLIAHGAVSAGHPAQDGYILTRMLKRASKDFEPYFFGLLNRPTKIHERITFCTSEEIPAWNENSPSFNPQTRIIRHMLALSKAKSPADFDALQAEHTALAPHIQNFSQEFQDNYKCISTTLTLYIARPQSLLIQSWKAAYKHPELFQVAPQNYTDPFEWGKAECAARNKKKKTIAQKIKELNCSLQ